MTCYFEHTEIQIKDKDWKCPHCGIGSNYRDKDGIEKDGWIVDDSPNLDCELLHEDDYLHCFRCTLGMSGLEYNNWYLGNKNKKVCKACNGTGFVFLNKGKPVK